MQQVAVAVLIAEGLADSAVPVVNSTGPVDKMLNSNKQILRGFKEIYLIGKIWRRF